MNEKEQRKEEDRQLLHEKGFLDGFGRYLIFPDSSETHLLFLANIRSRDKFLNRYRSKLYQSPIIPQENNKMVPPITFDKINNHERNYHLYNPESHSHGAMNLSFNQHSVTPLRGNRNRIEERGNQAVNRTIQTYYHNDLLDPTEENDIEQGEEKNMADNSKHPNKVIENSFWRYELLNFF